MLQINPSVQDVAIFKNERKNHPYPRVRQRMNVLWLKHNRVAHKKIAILADVSTTAVTKYIRMYNTEGVEKLREINFFKPQSKLVDFKASLEEYFRKHPPASVKEAMDKIEEITGIRRGQTQIRIFLKNRLGLKYRKVASVPAKADLKVQEDFKKKILEPKLKEARQGERKVFFVDAAHFVLAPFLGYLWSFARIFIKAPAGRKRFNVSGASDAISHKLYMITNDTYINAECICNLLLEIAKDNAGIPVTLILDNARYQKCKIVWESALKLDIELVYLPPYPPNLNLIERLWKFVKKQCLYSKFYSDFTDFKNAVSACLKNTDKKYKNEPDSLLNLKFQTFDESQLATV